MPTASEYIRKCETELESKDFTKALEYANKAIELDNSRYKAYLKKAIILQRLKDFQGSFKASELGIAKANKAGVRESIGEGQLRRAIALFSLKRYPDAAYSIDLADKYLSEKDPNKKSIAIWKMKIESNLRQIEDEDELVVLIDAIPNLADEPEVKSKVNDDDEGDWKIKELDDEDDAIPDISDKRTSSTGNTSATTSFTSVSRTDVASAATISTPAPISYPDPKSVRHDWFQMGNKCDVSIFIKDAPKDKVTVDYTESSANITFPISDNELYQYSLGPFSNSIDPAQSSFKVFSTKIELSLTKAVKASWKTLLTPEGEESFSKRVPVSLEEVRKSLANTTVNDEPAEGSTTSPHASAPTKPIVSFEKNWDKMATEALGKEDDSPDDFFQALYRDADDDTKKAILKSYTESGGTALSTNWNEVKKAPVPISPPDGLEARKF